MILFLIMRGFALVKDRLKKIVAFIMWMFKILYWLSRIFS